MKTSIVSPTLIGDKLIIGETIKSINFISSPKIRLRYMYTNSSNLARNRVDGNMVSSFPELHSLSSNKFEYNVVPFEEKDTWETYTPVIVGNLLEDYCKDLKLPKSFDVLAGFGEIIFSKAASTLEEKYGFHKGFNYFLPVLDEDNKFMMVRLNFDREYMDLWKIQYDDPKKFEKGFGTDHLLIPKQ